MGTEDFTGTGVFIHKRAQIFFAAIGFKRFGQIDGVQIRPGRFKGGRAFRFFVVKGGIVPYLEVWGVNGIWVLKNTTHCLLLNGCEAILKDQLGFRESFECYGKCFWFVDFLDGS
jgi:hypothetical protein